MDETPLLLACINRDTESRQGDASCVSNVSKLGSSEKEAVVVPARCICDSVTVTFLFLGFHLYPITMYVSKSLQECLAVQIKIFIADPHDLQQLTL